MADLSRIEVAELIALAEPEERNASGGDISPGCAFR